MHRVQLPIQKDSLNKVESKIMFVRFHAEKTFVPVHSHENLRKYFCGYLNFHSLIDRSRPLGCAWAVAICRRERRHFTWRVRVAKLGGGFTWLRGYRCICRQITGWICVPHIKRFQHKHQKLM